MKLYGWSRAQFLGMTLADIRPPADVPRLRQQVANSHDRWASPVGEWRHFKNNGASLDVEVIVSAIRFGGRDARLSMIRDITERKRAEAALRESEASLRTLVNGNPESIFLIDTQGTILAANQTTAERLGKNLDQIVGARIDDLMPAEIARPRRARVEEVIRTGRAVRFEDRRAERLFDCHMQPVLDEAGKVFRLAILARDITERKRAEDVLRESEATLRTLINGHPESIFLLATDGNIVAANQKMAERLGKTVDQVVGTNIFTLMPPKVAASRRAWGKQVIRTGRSVHFEDQREGRFFDSFVHPIFDAGGNVFRLAIMAQDITERKQTEAELRHKQAELEEAQKIAKIGSWTFDIPENSVRWSAELYRIFEVEASADQCTYEAFLASIHPDDRAKVLQTNARARATGKPFQVEYRIRTPGGCEKHLREIGYAIRGESGRIVGLFGTAQDITTAHEAQEALRRLTRELLQAQDEERRRIARELHDTTAQNLVSLLFDVSHVRNKLAGRAPAESQVLDESAATIKHTIEQIRTLSFLLHPPQTGQLGLGQAIQDFAVAFGRRAGMEIAVAIPRHLPAMPPEFELAILRILQEALWNAYRHSGSTSAKITLRRKGTKLLVAIADDGHGMVAERGKARKKTSLPLAGVGLSSMRERLRHLGGRLEISTGSQGTTLTAVLFTCGLKSRQRASPSRPSTKRTQLPA